MSAVAVENGVDSQVESFFKTLLLGDFEEQQNTAAQIVGGLISLIPVLDQVLDARDISGALFNINKRGGFGHASSDQLVNLGFAAFGAVPEVGSAFKTVFKPLWKERRAAKGAVHGGLEAVEALLGMRKGGAIGWVRNELLGKWAARSQQAVMMVEAALASCVQLTEFVATASGWQDWLIPDPVQALAKELLPGLKALQGQVQAPLARASDEIREFLEDLLGEQAAAVVMAVGQHAVQASAVAGTRSRSGHNAADLHPKGSVPARQAPQKVHQQHKAEASKGQGPVHATIKATRKTFGDLAAREKGLIGEHVVDYHELQRLGGAWTHDNHAGQWRPEAVRKLNCDKRPVNLSLADLPKVNHAGIDAVWEHHGHYTVTEAKASESIAVAYGFGKYKVKKGWVPKVEGLNPDLELLHYLLIDYGDKGGGGASMMQMSKEWVRDRADREHLGLAVVSLLKIDKALRRVVLVTFESQGAVDHGMALADLHMGKSSNDLRAHTEHGITREWNAAAIDAVAAAREKAHDSTKVNQRGTSVAEPGRKPTKSKKRGK